MPGAVGCDAAFPQSAQAGAAWRAPSRRAGPEGGPGSRKAAALASVYYGLEKGR
ncbi:MAG: hypothetical protein KBA97_03410 [Methanothrix sp.]|nr:hypothetical protein [Methanothrix sp.]